MALRYAPIGKLKFYFAKLLKAFNTVHYFLFLKKDYHINLSQYLFNGNKLLDIN